MSIEILAPAGGTESVYAAVRCGADAVYVGGERFSARAGADNFSREELLQAVEYCHLHNVKIYQAVNTLFFDSELKAVLDEVKFACEAGVDALIVQDLGAAKMIKRVFPQMRLNASTQMTVHTPEGALAAKELGFSRVVLSRELSLEQIKKICDTGVETEVFVHGALCMSVSGQCFMSALIGSRSANRGMCAQACRLPFSAFGNDSERHDLSLKDVSAINHINALAVSGVHSFKIEGRMKRAEYVAAAVSACKAAEEGRKPNLEALEAVFSRSGFTDGYITGKLGSDMFGIRRKEDVEAAEKVLPQLKELYRKETKCADLNADFNVKIKCGEKVELEMSCDGEKVKVVGEEPQQAINKPTDLAQLEKQLSKLGDTPYGLGKITAEIDDGLIVPSSEINLLRRNAVEKTNARRISAKRAEIAYYPEKSQLNKTEYDDIAEIKKPVEIRLFFRKYEQLDGVDNLTAKQIILPLCELEKNQNRIKNNAEICAALPRFVTDEKQLEESLNSLKQLGVRKLLCGNIAHIRLGKRLGYELCGDFGLNVTNSQTLEAYAQMGLSDAVLSFELKLPQANGIKRAIPTGLIVYGRLPLMLTRNCPIKQAVGSCAKCTGELTDRTSRKFPVRCNGITAEILNCDKMVMSDRMREISTDFVRFDFNEESAEEINAVLRSYERGGKPTGTFTRGLYYRGIN